MAARRVGNDLSRRKSDPTSSSKLGNNEAVVAAELPWGSLKVVGNMSIDFHSLPAKFTVQNLLLELFSMFEKKIQYVCVEEPLDKFLNKSLKRCDDTYLDNLLRTLGNVSEVCLPSILEALIKWYEEQISIRKRNTNENKDRSQKALLAVNYLFCIVLIELLPQLHFHPTDCEKYVNYILHLSFNEISKGNRDPAAYGVNLHNCLIVAETFAEVIGVLSQTHAKLVQKTFFTLLNEYRKETPLTQSMVTNIISLLMAMKFYRIKTSQVSEIEQGVSFLDELASYYLEIDLKQKDLKHAIVGLLVEILLPVAAQIKTEANIPALIAFVDKLYGPTLELINKKQHKMAAYPLLTCLLCISQSKFFLNNWVQFLNTTLSNLKNRDPKISRVALESLYRLLWVYIIRNNCEGNTQTRNRLECICNSIFPKGNRSVVPRDAPLNIFVKIIHFIAQQKLDFAFKEIIFDLLGCNRVTRSNTITIYPERMNIGIRALMVIADGLQQKEGPPGMPRAIVPVASGTIQRMRKTYLTRPLTADVARSIGLDLYYLPCRKAFDAILRTLDTDVGKCLMLTSSRTKGKEPDDLIGSDMKPKLDLFRTCIAAIPRLLPEPMPHHDLIDLLTRMTVHMDEELRQTAYLTLQNLITECADWREDIIHTYIGFLTNHIQDTFPMLLESAVRFLLQLLCFWKSAIQQEKKKENQQPALNGITSITAGRGTTVISNSAGVIVPTTSATNITSHQSVQSEGGNVVGQQQLHLSPLMNNASAIALHNVEGLALALLCQTRVQGKKMAISLLREVKSLFTLMELHDKPVLTVLDEATPYVLNKYIEHVPLAERQSWNQDFASACDKICTIDTDDNLVNSDKGNEYMHWDTWACALSGYCEYKFLPEQCPTAVNFAWPTLFVRLNACNQFVDPNNPQNENRASLLRSSRSKATASTLCGEALDQGSYLSLWQKYLVMSCALTQPPSQHTSVLARSFSPNGNLDSIDSVRSMTSSFRGPRTSSQVNCIHLFQKISSMLRWEQTRDMRDNVVLGIGSTNPRCFDLLLDELSTKGILREAQERKNESNVRRRKRRDLLRLQVVRVIEVAMFRGLLSASNLVDAQNGQLSHILLDLFSAIRVNVESDSDRDISTITSLRLHFAKTITLMVNSIPLEKRKTLIPADKKQEFMILFLSWCGGAISQTDRKHARDIGTYVELKAMHALCSMLCCGPSTESYSSSGHVKDTIVRWIEMIFMSTSQTVQNICEDMLSTVLHLNDQNSALFEFVVNMCYKQPSEFAKRYFKSLVMLFSKREYPCELVSMLVLCQVYAGDNDDTIRQSAAWLIQILRRQFLDDTSVINLSSTLHTSMSIMSDESFKGENISVVLRSKRAPGFRLFPISQFFICHQLSQQYPSLTMEMISELFSRLTYLKDISRHIQASILNTLVYWMENIELIDSNCELLIIEDDGITRERGYGNEEATRLILNNLLYITAMLPAEHQSTVGRLWKTLVTKYPSNLNVVIQYLFIAMSLSPDHVIVLAKRVAKHLLNACGERFIAILVNQLSMMTDQFKMTLVRHEVAPYYRWQLPHSNEETMPTDETKEEQRLEEQEETVETENDLNTSSPDQKPESLNQSHKNLPKELPMPAYGGFYADLRPLLLVSNQPIVHFTKSNLALFLLCDLIGNDEDFSVDWNNHLTTIVHSSVLCLDAVRPLVCRHARKALINIALLYASAGTNTGVLANLLQNNVIEMERLEVIERYSGTNDDVSIFYSNGTESTLSQRTETPSFAAALHGEYRQMLLQSKSVFNSSTDLLQALVFCLSERMDKPLWINEDVGPRGWRIESSEQLSCFVYHLSQYLNGCISNFNFKWTDVAISCALSINNRHLAGRSFQMASALCQNPTPWIGRMLSRLAELVGDHNEDTQGYITHMMLCLHSLVPYVRISLEESARSMLHSPSSPTGHNRSISYTPALLSNQQQNAQMSMTSAGSSASTTASPLKNSPINNIISPSHSSYKKEARHSMLIENEMPSTVIQTPLLNRSKSAATLKVDTSLTNEDSIGAFVQLMSIAVAMLESHVDNEYLLALTLMDKLLEAAGPDRDCCLQRLHKTIKELDWCGFSGVIGLVCKGVVYVSGYETCVSLLVKCTSLLHEPVVASPNSFSLIVTAILPYLINGFDNMTPLCITAAQTISDYCVEHLPEAAKDVPELTIQDHPLSYLSTMMIQYRNNSFTRDRFQWTKCVVNYLMDAEKPNSVQLVVFLAEMLERCPPTTHMYLLHIIYLIISHGDLSEASPVPINAQMIRIVSKHIQGVNWKEAARIVKTVVDQWNSISVSQVSAAELGTDKRKPKFELYFGSGDNANSTNAISQTVSPPTPRKVLSTTGTGISNHSTATGSSNGPSPGAGNVDSLRRQTTTVQSKVRERLIGLLAASGMQVGIPKSASFIFSQSTSDLYHEGLGGNATANNNCGTLQGATSNSAYSSSERISHLDDLEAMSGSSLAAGGNEPSIGTDSFPRVFKEFDFLEAEHDSISESTESGFNWLSTIRPPRGIRNSRSGENGDDTLGDDFINPGEGEDDEEEDDIDETTDRGDLDIRSNVNRHHGHRDDRTLKKRHRRPLSGASESNDISSDRTPVQSEKHSDDSCPSCPNSDEEDDELDDDEDDDELEEIDEFKSQKSQRGASSLEDTASITCPVGEDPLSTNLDTASSIQCRSEFSIQNTSDYGARKAPIYLECNHHSSGQVEQVWLSLVNVNGSDNDGEMTAHCILFFSQLFRECCVKMSGLLRDASLIMTSSLATSSSFSQSPNNQRDVSGYFTHALDVLTKAADCPFLFITAQFLRATDLLQTQKYKLYELGGHYETFIERREQCIRALNAMSSSLKLLKIGGSTLSYNNGCNQEIELSKCIHKLFFQLLQMLDKLYDMIKTIQTSPNAEEYDLSPAVLCLHRDLLACMSEMPASDSRVSTSSSLNVLPRNDQHFDTLVLHMANKQYKNAIIALRQLRSQYGSEFGCCDHMDVDVLLLQFCRSHTLRTWALVGSIQTLDHSCTQLKEISMQFAALVRTLVSDASTGASVRSSRVSSVHESTFSAAPTTTNSNNTGN